MTAIGDSLDLPIVPSLWRRHGWQTLGAGTVTVLVGCGVLAAALHGGVPPSRAGMLALMATTVWVGLAAAPLGAGAGDWIGALLRGGIAADAGIVTLLAVGLFGGGTIGWSSGVKVYLLWLPVALSATLATRCGRSALARSGIAAGAAVVALATMGSLVWSAGLLAALGPDRQAAAARLVLWPNTLAGVVAAAGPAEKFVWIEQPVMYAVTRMGQDFPPAPLTWWMPACLWWALAGALAAGLLIRHGGRRFVYGVTDTIVE